MALRYSSAAVAMGHNALTRAIRHAEARDLVGRNVALLVETPKGQAGRPSKSLSLEQAAALLAAAVDTRMHAYIALCLATGIRTEEARALRWENVTSATRPPTRLCRPARPCGGPCGLTGIRRRRIRAGRWHSPRWRSTRSVPTGSGKLKTARRGHGVERSRSRLLHPDRRCLGRG